MRRPPLHMMRRGILCISLILLIASIVISGVSALQPILSVDPVKSEVTGLGKYFTIDVNVSDVTDLMGFEFKMWYNTTLLDAVNCTPLVQTSFLAPIDPDTFEWIPINDTLGRIYLGATTQTPLSGDIQLMRINFTTTGIGSTSLMFNETELSNKFGTIMEHEVVSGSVTILAELIVHDVAVTDVNAPAEATQGDDITINVDVTNLGGYDETFNVTIRYDSKVIGTKPVTLVLGNSTTIPFSWETAGVSPKTYTITAEAILAGDADLTNNNATTTILIKPPPGAIAGTVTDALTGDPIPGANVTVTPGDYTNTTEADGHYMIADVPPDDYTVNASKTGYISNSTSATVVSGETTTVDFTLTLAVHDVAILNVVPPSILEVDVGDSVDIKVIIKNKGNVGESFTVNLYADVNLIGTETDTLAAGSEKTYNFTWNTAGVALGKYTIKAEAPPVTGETDTDDNIYTTEWGIDIIPEFPTLIPLLLALAILAVSTIVLKRRHL